MKSNKPHSQNLRMPHKKTHTGKTKIGQSPLAEADHNAVRLRKKSRGVDSPVSAHQNSMDGLADDQTLNHHTGGLESENENDQSAEQRLQRQKMEAIGAMVGGIAHDFNNLLHPILAFAAMGLRKAEESSALQNYFNGINISANRARELVEQILAFSRNDKADLRPMSLQNLIREVLEIQRASLPAMIRIKQDIDETCGRVAADAIGIHQVIMNLTTNAYHAMQDTGGDLTVSLKRMELKPKRMNGSVSQTNQFVCMTVTDSGIGMEADIAKQIFDPFFTTRRHSKGTGLGLSIVADIIKNHNGSIEVDSTPGKGSVFKVFLPLATTEAKPSSKKTEPEQLEGHEEILVVDSDKGHGKNVKRVFQDLGYAVSWIADGQKAWVEVQENPGKYALVIADLSLPGLAGYRLALKILDLRPDIPIVLYSDSNQSINEKKARAVGIKALLTKPIDAHNLGNQLP